MWPGGPHCHNEKGSKVKVCQSAQLLVLTSQLENEELMLLYNKTLKNKNREWCQICPGAVTSSHL